MENAEVEESFGNIFEDLGFPNAEEGQAKTKLGIEIFLIIKARNLTQKEVTKIMKTSQSHVSDILRGKLSNPRKQPQQARKCECSKAKRAKKSG